VGDVKKLCYFDFIVAMNRRNVTSFLAFVLLFLSLGTFFYVEFQQRTATLNCDEGSMMMPTSATTMYSVDDREFARISGIHLVANSTKRVKGVIFMLARNSDLEGAKHSIKQLEARFNRHYHYPYVYMNDEPFSDRFKQAMRALAPHSRIQFGVIPTEHWSYPPWINQSLAADKRKDMASKGIIYGGSESYRHMCRYNSGFFFRHRLLDPYDYYWRVEPDVDFPCDIPDDPFRYMQEHNKLYGFTISLHEIPETIRSLWRTVREFAAQNPILVRPDVNALPWLTTPDGDDYNGCHFWSNFEIASLHLWRSTAYKRFFDHLDKTGGFFYERWGDAPVHSIAATMLLKPSQIHFFNEIGYRHTSLQHCPADQPVMAARNCRCSSSDSFDYSSGSCTARWVDLYLPGGRDKLGCV
jgi:alpha 1,2-mannosyltransferase